MKECRQIAEARAARFNAEQSKLEPRANPITINIEALKDRLIFVPTRPADEPAR